MSIVVDHPELSLVVGVVFSVSSALLGRYLWDRFSAPERLADKFAERYVARQVCDACKTMQHTANEGLGRELLQFKVIYERDRSEDRERQREQIGSIHRRLDQKGELIAEIGRKVDRLLQGMNGRGAGRGPDREP